jgi:hypothetical protein
MNSAMRYHRDGTMCLDGPPCSAGSRTSALSARGATPRAESGSGWVARSACRDKDPSLFFPVASGAFPRERVDHCSRGSGLVLLASAGVPARSLT